MQYCIGDVHGCAKTLEILILQIIRKDKNPEFYFVGDLIDRGPDSKSVIDLLIELNQKNYKVEVVRGNHEEMFLNAYTRRVPIIATNWYKNGAEQTISSFTAKYNLNKTVKDYIPEPYFNFIYELPYYIELEDYFIVHAGFNFKLLKPFEDFEYMLWTRTEQNKYEFTNGKKIIHGHTPISKEQIEHIASNNSSDVINIDSGCVYVNRNGLGYLTALNLDTMELKHVKNIDMLA